MATSACLYRIARSIELLLGQLEVLDLDDAEAEAVCTAWLSRLQERSGLDSLDFHAAVSAALPCRPGRTLQ